MTDFATSHPRACFGVLSRHSDGLLFPLSQGADECGPFVHRFGQKSADNNLGSVLCLCPNCSCSSRTLKISWLNTLKIGSSKMMLLFDCSSEEIDRVCTHSCSFSMKIKEAPDGDAHDSHKRVAQSQFILVMHDEGYWHQQEAEQTQHQQPN